MDSCFAQVNDWLHQSEQRVNAADQSRRGGLVGHLVVPGSNDDAAATQLREQASELHVDLESHVR